MATLPPSQTSVAAGVVKAAAAPHGNVALGAQVSTGGVVSRMLIVWLQVARLVQESSASQVRVTVNLIGQTPAFVVVLTMRMLTFVPSQLS